MIVIVRALGTSYALYIFATNITTFLGFFFFEIHDNKQTEEKNPLRITMRIERAVYGSPFGCIQSIPTKNLAFINIMPFKKPLKLQQKSI